MRKITQEAVEAFLKNRNYIRDNPYDNYKRKTEWFVKIFK